MDEKDLKGMHGFEMQDLSKKPVGLPSKAIILDSYKNTLGKEIDEIEKSKGEEKTLALNSIKSILDSESLANQAVFNYSGE